MIVAPDTDPTLCNRSIDLWRGCTIGRSEESAASKTCDSCLSNRFVCMSYDGGGVRA